MTEFPESTVYDTAAGVYYVPFLADDGRVGYRCGKTGEDAETFIYLNPTTDSSGSPTPDVFVYEGTENVPALDEAQVFVVPESW